MSVKECSSNINILPDQFPPFKKQHSPAQDLKLKHSSRCKLASVYRCVATRSDYKSSSFFSLLSFFFFLSDFFSISCFSSIHTRSCSPLLITASEVIDLSQLCGTASLTPHAACSSGCHVANVAELFSRGRAVQSEDDAMWESTGQAQSGPCIPGWGGGTGT